MSGLFITFEGGEGAGKSTQIKRVAEHFRELGREVVLTREPGGTPAGEHIRMLLVNGDTNRFSATAEALLNYAARDAHLREVIRPALQKNQVVLCDRFFDSTRAYQAVAGDCPIEIIDILECEIVADTRPDLTLIFDLDPAIGLARAKSRGEGLEDRYERKGLAFHTTLRRAFLDIAAQEPTRCVILDASGSIDQVWERVLLAMRERGHGG